MNPKNGAKVGIFNNSNSILIELPFSDNDPFTLF